MTLRFKVSMTSKKNAVTTSAASAVSRVTRNGHFNGHTKNQPQSAAEAVAHGSDLETSEIILTAIFFYAILATWTMIANE